MDEETEIKYQVFLAILSIAAVMLTLTKIIMSEKELKRIEAETKLQEIQTEYYQKILKGEERQWTTY